MLMSYYQNKQEEWDEKTCDKMSKKWIKDSFGTKTPKPGMIPFLQNGRIKYNGGCVRGEPEEWYDGEEFFLPKLTKNFEWIYVPTWYFRIVKKNNKKIKE